MIAKVKEIAYGFITEGNGKCISTQLPDQSIFDVSNVGFRELDLVGIDGLDEDFARGPLDMDVTDMFGRDSGL